MWHSQNYVYGSRDVGNHFLPAVRRTYLSNFGNSKPVFRQFSSLALRADVSPIGLHDIRWITSTVTDFFLRRLVQTGYEVSTVFFFYGAAARLPDLLTPVSSLRWCHRPDTCLEHSHGISPQSILQSTSKLSKGSAASGIWVSCYYLLREAESQPISTRDNFHVVTSNRLL
jgi:hypothetical protein